MSVNIGDIIVAKYIAFDGEIDTGYFLVYSKDNYWLSNTKSFSALKVCTNPLSYQVELKKERFPFLDHTSYINCSCQQRFSEGQVIAIKGVVNGFILDKVKKQLAHFNTDVDNQLDSAIQQYNRIAYSIYNSPSQTEITQDEEKVGV